MNLAHLETADIRAELRRLETYCPHEPSAKQRQFLALNTFEALYGGAAGGGKSDALIMGALAYIHEPRFASLLLRKTYKDLNLSGAIMARSHEWFRGTSASWSAQDYRWTFPSGASMSFGYMDSLQDRERYQSAEFQYIAFDELTHFEEGQYTYMASRLRKPPGMDVPLKLRAGSNPGGRGHDWVYERFVAEGAPQPFVPALLDDNPGTDGVSYRQALSHLDAVTRRQLENGEWIRSGEGLVFQLDEARDCVERLPS